MKYLHKGYQFPVNLFLKVQLSIILFNLKFLLFIIFNFSTCKFSTILTGSVKFNLCLYLFNNQHGKHVNITDIFFFGTTYKYDKTSWINEMYSHRIRIICTIINRIVIKNVNTLKN